MLRIFTGSPPQSSARTSTWPLDTRPRSATVSKRHDYHDLIRPWRIWHHHGQRIELIERPDVVLVAERNVNGVADRADFDIRRYDRRAAADGGPHRLAYPRVQQRRRVLDITGGSNDRRLTIGDRRPRQQWQTFMNQPLAEFVTKHDK